MQAHGRKQGNGLQLAQLRPKHLGATTHRWAELEAKELLNGDHKNGQVRSAFFGNPIERRRWLRNGLYGRSPLFVRPFLYWIYRYVLRLGFLDGKEGFIFHFLQGFWFRLLVDIKLDEMRKQEREGARRL